MLTNLGNLWDETFEEVEPVDVLIAEIQEGTEVERAIAFREEVKCYAIAKGYMNGVLPIVM